MGVRRGEVMIIMLHLTAVGCMIAALILPTWFFFHKDLSSVVEVATIWMTIGPFMECEGYTTFLDNSGLPGYVNQQISCHAVHSNCRTSGINGDGVGSLDSVYCQSFNVARALSVTGVGFSIFTICALAIVRGLDTHSSLYKTLKGWAILLNALSVGCLIAPLAIVHALYLNIQSGWNGPEEISGVANLSFLGPSYHLNIASVILAGLAFISTIRGFCRAVAHYRCVYQNSNDTELLMNHHDPLAAPPQLYLPAQAQYTPIAAATPSPYGYSSTNFIQAQPQPVYS